jgi:hypothetical protein
VTGRPGTRYGKPNSTGWRIVGALALLVGLLLLVVGQRWQVVPLIAGGWSAVPAIMELSARRRAALLLREESEALFGAEKVAFDTWREQLADRPHDGEMARWLALDQAHLKAVAMDRGKIAESDLVSHMVITQLAPAARRGAVPDGPPRYEAYHVHVMLLTRRGIRASRMYLKFATGEFKNEMWKAFGYDRIASASMNTTDTTGRNSSGEPMPTRHREFRRS